MDKRFDIVGLGEPMIEFNETGTALYRQGFGGDTANFAIAAARQGANVAYYTRLGDDRFGRMFLDLWAKERIDTSAVGIDQNAHTGVYFVTHGTDGHQFEYLRAGSAASRMTVDDLPLNMLRDTRFLHVSGISQAISPTACDAVGAAVATASAAGASITYDPNLRLRLWSLAKAKATIEATIPHIDIFLPSLDEALILADADNRDDVFAWCARHGAKNVVLKCGAEGAWIWQESDGVPRHVPGFAVQPIDATGAGDCFDGSLVARLAVGESLLDAVRYANVAAAISTTGYGAIAPIPHQADVLIKLVNKLAVTMTEAAT
ncbi:sugar kinase [Glaciimonas sp. GS1]|uniref:Sugar kinase n=1 Tax=Glaciimonas soli TaxID=2590999 RepID=A0A843YNW5_9BURK|nr:sugar kinase [Glaciimonas soli]MQQ99070.1 sugar kinase [Glaciimonas soli]